tara:strand:- start:10 stop:282 length:273 start_codon:yes stop_codon:yes gene_type:complete
MAKKPNKEIRERYKRAINFGCVVCKKMGIWSEPQIHHLRINTGMGLKSDKFIPLCYQHHMIEYHRNPKEFEKNYGLQEELYKWYIENDRD